jgi:hypothetical protein
MIVWAKQGSLTEILARGSSESDISGDPNNSHQPDSSMTLSCVQFAEWSWILEKTHQGFENHLNSMEVTLNDQADLGQKAERRHIFE